MKSQIDTPMSFPAIAGREYIWTYTGQKFFFDDPGPCIKLVDIAHALSLICRWTGHVREFYSVAEHCVRCSYFPAFEETWERTQKTATPRFALRKLLHDASEAYMSDLNKPLKNLLAGSTVKDTEFYLDSDSSKRSSYDEIEVRLERAIWKKYGLTETMDDIERREVKEADLALAMTEARDLLSQNSVAHYGTAKPLKYVIQPWSPDDAEYRFLERFKELM